MQYIKGFLNNLQTCGILQFLHKKLLILLYINKQRYIIYFNSIKNLIQLYSYCTIKNFEGHNLFLY